MGRPLRALWLGEGYTITDDGRGHPAPDGWAAGGIGELLTRVAGRFDDQGVILLDRRAGELLGLPVAPGEIPRDHEGRLIGLPDHPAVPEAARAGWSVKKISDWSTFTGKDRPTVRVAITTQLDLGTDRDGNRPRMPLWGPSPADTTACLAWWHDLTGSAYHGHPGMAGTTVLSRLEPTIDGHPPTWKPKITGPDDAEEKDYVPKWWRAPRPGPGYIHGYDLNRAYIAAAMVAEVSPFKLQHTGRIAFDKRRAGWWLAELAPWNESRLPDPAGYTELDNPTLPTRERKRVRWITTPTLTLLEDLTAQGVYGGVRLLDSWTGPARDGVLRAWAERMRDAYAFRSPSGELLDLDELDGPRMRYAVKMAGRATLGLFFSPTNWIYRPDWWFAVVALTRCNLWRKLAKVARTDGRYPLTVDVDNIHYHSEDANARRAFPAALVDQRGRPLFDQAGLKLGCFKHKRTWKVAEQR